MQRARDNNNDVFGDVIDAHQVVDVLLRKMGFYLKTL